MKKTLAFGIVLLFIGVAFVPLLYADVETVSEKKELIEIPIQICGLGGINEYTAKLSKEDADRLDTLFVDIHSRLNASESREETISIYKDAVVELDNLGLLGGYSVEQVQKLVTGELYENSLIMKLLKMLIAGNSKLTDDYDNTFCSVSGIVSECFLFPMLYWTKLHYQSDFFLFFPDFLIKRTSLCGYLSFGWGAYGPHTNMDYESEGFLSTEGTKGVKNWTGPFIGNLFEYEISTIPMTYFYWDMGISGFLGLKIGHPTKLNMILGFALNVDIRSL